MKMNLFGMLMLGVVALIGGVGCSGYQMMEVDVRQQKTRQPIKNVAVEVSYAEPGWWWPFAPEGDEGVTDAGGKTEVKMKYYGRGTMIEIAGQVFKVTQEVFENGGIFQNTRFRATMTPRKPDK
ncbi:hypothetical protein KS4_37120 [Poriferisphaera corsica]|uniref:Uncharacterized protein n=1 Tax=Poriferisphaera corsica TaxID=2528020 RepID=A0A517YZK7_9BACT|nr:hypothetical protein [Poriferisphaera corsica]QDU35629.1 hypothetical protein KS4_37120 [Poriferisphaera corsica]